MSKPAELALELGLLYEGNFFGPEITQKMDKNRVRKLVLESPEDFTFLTHNNAPQNTLEKAAYDYLKNSIPGLFSELRNLVESRMSGQKGESTYTFSSRGERIKTGNVHADYLISLIRDPENPYTVKAYRGVVYLEDHYREFDKHEVTSRIFAWAEKDQENESLTVPLEELKKFVKSGSNFIQKEYGIVLEAGKDIPSDVGGLAPYTRVWQNFSEASQVRLFANRRAPSPGFFAGFSKERLEFIVQWVHLIYEQRIAAEKEKSTAEKQGEWEMAEKEALESSKENAGKDKIEEIDQKLKDLDDQIRIQQEKKDFDKATEAFPLKKLDMLLKKHQTKAWVSKKTELTNFKYKVLNLLSSTKKWDAQLALIKYYLPDQWEKYETAAMMYEYDENDKPVLKTDIKNIFEEKHHGKQVKMDEFKKDLEAVFNKLADQLHETNLSSQQIEQIKGMVYHRGAFENKAAKEVDQALHYPESEKTEKDYSTTNYQKLKKQARKNNDLQ